MEDELSKYSEDIQNEVRLGLKHNDSVTIYYNEFDGYYVSSNEKPGEIIVTFYNNND